MRKTIFALLLAMTVPGISLFAQSSDPTVIGPVVTTLKDSGPGSLRQVISSSGRGLTITFDPNLSGQVILLTNGLIELTNSLTINGSTLPVGIRISGNQNSPIFQIDGGTTVTLDSLTLMNGSSATGLGGAIFSEGNLTLNDCALVNNQSGGTAGAMACAFGSLVMNRCTISGNSGNNCSGIYIQDQPATIADCTFSGNQGSDGDALRLQAGYGNPTLSVVNSTFSGNLISSSVGAAVSIMSVTGLTATAYFTNCTVVSNLVGQTAQPGAIFLQPGGGINSLTLYNCTVSDNTSGGAFDDITGTVDPGSSYNLIGVGGGLVNGANANLTGITNPQLAALGNYGGNTQTMPPLPGSPAINAGGPTGLTTDQRGFPRTVNGATDIGAVESQNCSNSVSVNSPTIIAGASATLTATNTATAPIYLWNDGETSQSITVSPSSTTNYTVQVFDSLTACIAIGSGTVTVVNPLITWPTPAPITYGTLLDSNQLDATASLSGTFTYDPPAGTALDAGTQTLSTIFLAIGASYFSVTDTVALVVAPAPLTVTVSNLTRAFGQTNPILTGSVVGLQNSDNITATFSCNAGLYSKPGSYPITVALVDPGNRLGNYLVTTNPGVLTVTSGAQIVAHDDSAAYAPVYAPTPYPISPNLPPYGTNVPPYGTWMSGQNFGFGFLPWVIQTNGPAIQEAFIGSGGSIAAANGSAWGLYAYGQPLTNTVVAFRGLSNSLPVGLAFKLQWRSSYIGTNSYNYAGFSLRTGNASASTADATTGEELAFLYRGSADTTSPTDDVIIRDGAGENYAPAPGVNFENLRAGISVECTLLTSNTYRLVILDAATSNTLATFDNRSLEGTGTIDSLALIDNQTDPFNSDIDGSQYFNNLEIANPQIPVTPAALVTPATLLVTPGSTATFTSTATGTPPLIYQWQFNGNNITGANGSSLTISNTQVGNGGEYEVVVTSPYATAISAPATLSLVTPTTILVPPASAQVTVGGNASFTVVALSSAPLTYQWFFAGYPIEGATGPTYKVLDAQLSSAGTYTVQILNQAGAVTTASAALMVVPATQPAVTTLSYTVNIQAGTNLIANQLDQGGDTLYEIMPVVPDGTIVSKYDNASGTWSTATYNAKLGAWDPSSIVLRPGEGAVLISPINFSLTFTGTPHVPSLPLNIPDGQAWLVSRQTNDLGTYENIVGASPAPGAVIYQWNPTNSNYTLYTYSADGWSGGVEPTAAVGESLWIGPAGGTPVAIPNAPAITLQPTNVMAALGGSAMFTVAASGTPPLSYQWQLNGNAIPGATNPVYNIPDVLADSAGNYSVAIVNSIGVANSAIVSLDLLDIGTLPLADDFANAGLLPNPLGGLGTGANFGATIEPGEPGPGTITFGSSVWIQWQPPVDGIASLTTAGSGFDTVLGVFTGTQLSDLQLVAADDDSGPDLTSALQFNAVAGTTYYIQISGFYGQQGDIVLAWNLTPTADTVPIIVLQPQSQTQTNSGPVTLSVLVTNTAPGVSYQWALNTVPLVGATQSVYVISSLDKTQVGLYTLGITNILTFAGVGSDSASVEIFNPGPDQPGNFINVHPQDKFLNAGALTPHDPNIPHDPSFAGGYTGTQTYSTIGATADPGEPDHCGFPPCHSIWYSYVPPTSGLLTMTTTNNFDAALEVYTGPATSYATIIPLACSANHGTNGEMVGLSVIGGSNYWVVVDGVDCASGNFTLAYSLSSPPVFGALPLGQTVTNGGTITLVASTTGTPPFFYQWKYQGMNIPNATNSSLVISNFQAINQGDYSVVTWNPSGTNVSSQAALYLSSPPRFVSFGVISGSVSAQFVGIENTNYVFQASSNLAKWFPITTNSSPIGIFNFYDSVPPSVGNRFYRAVSQ